VAAFSEIGNHTRKDLDCVTVFLPGAVMIFEMDPGDVTACYWPVMICFFMFGMIVVLPLLKHFVDGFHPLCLRCRSCHLFIGVSNLLNYAKEAGVSVPVGDTSNFIPSNLAMLIGTTSRRSPRVREYPK
jgi:hypothetical protein